MSGRPWVLRLTAAELRGLRDYLAVTLNDPDSLDSAGFTGREKRSVHGAAEQVDALYARMVADEAGDVAHGRQSEPDTEPLWGTGLISATAFGAAADGHLGVLFADAPGREAVGPFATTSGAIRWAIAERDKHPGPQFTLVTRARSERYGYQPLTRSAMLRLYGEEA